MSKKGKNILLTVDDKPDNIFILHQVIGKYLPDCELLSAGSGGEGLELAAAHDLDGILLDVQMPGMDGIEMCRRLKSDEHTASVPVILITAHQADAGLKARGLEAGADDFISKPIDNLELVAKIKVMLRIKRIEDELREMNLRLEERVQERTAELGKANLQLQQEMIRRKRMENEILNARKLESLGILAGGIAHDFNNLLTAILGNISFARSSGDTDNIPERLEAAERACIRAQDLTRQLLTFSKGGAPVKKTISLAGLLKECVSFVLRGSNVRGEFDIPQDLWPVEADEGQLYQVMSNLVINADQAMPQGGMIKVSARNREIQKDNQLLLNAGSYVEISVGDSGVGIAEKDLQSIFDPFFSTKQKGKGLGLATSYSIIKNHGGRITVESLLGKGTTFQVYIPSSMAEAIEEKEQKSELHLSGTGRVLVMDDEDMIRKLTAACLGNIGYEVVTAADGAEAIKLFKEAREAGKPFDVVIMDLTVPGGMGGKEALKGMVEIDPGVKAIVSSGYSNDPIMASYREFGFSNSIAKPYKIVELYQVLHDVLS